MGARALHANISVGGVHAAKTWQARIAMDQKNRPFVQIGRGGGPGVAGVGEGPPSPGLLRLPPSCSIRSLMSNARNTPFKPAAMPLPLRVGRLLLSCP